MQGTAVLHPDTALVPLIQAYPETFRTVLNEFAQALRTPPLRELDIAFGLGCPGVRRCWKRC
jgi:hypothetical protein